MRERGFSVLEIVLAVALFMIFATAAIVVVVGGYNANRQGVEFTIANQFAAEGLEAVRSIKNRGFSNLVNTAGTGILRNANNVWAFGGANNTLTHNITDNYTRVIKIEDVRRDATPPDGNIVVSGGTLDRDSKKITSTVTWNFSAAIPESLSLVTYLSDFKKPIRSGLLVYGDGGTSSDAIKYKIYDGSTVTWGTEAAAADVDSATTNRALRVARVYASATREEKILISKHYNGSSQYIYAQVFNGTNWGDVQLLSTWASTSFINTRNFDGAYLSNGNFMVVYSDNTTTPQYRIWNGTLWGTQSSTVNVGGIPNYVVAKVRPGTSEVMMVTFDQVNDTNSTYFNGTAWSSATEHSAQAPTNTKEHADFTWSVQNNLKGALVYAAQSTDNDQNLKIWTANGSGDGSWSATANGPNTGGRLGPVDIDGRKGAEEFLSCQKNANNKIICFEANTTPSWVTPADNTLTNNTEAGIQRSYNIAYESYGDEAIAVYSDDTTTPKLKKYNTATDAFDASETSLNTLGGILTTVRLKALDTNDDIFIFLASGTTLYSQMWDGINNTTYVQPSGKAFTTHGSNGSALTDHWYDFAWDAY